MDSLTHVAVGAAIGEAYAGKPLGKRALLLGAIFQSIPDVDFINSFFLSPTDNLLAHRGFTHSILFGVGATLILSVLANRWLHSKEFSFNRWLIFVGLEIFVHLFLDAFNAYGVGWLEPFFHNRISFHVLFVADPLFSLWPGIAFIVLLITKQNSLYRLRWATFALLLSAIYLCYSLVNKSIINKRMEQSLLVQHIDYSRYFTTPTAFNTLLWYCVAESDSGYYISYSSVFDKSEQLSFQYFPQQKSLIRGIEAEQEFKNLVRFSNGYYTIERIDDDALLFNDLRFGRIAGWKDIETEFAFHYYLQNPQRNILVVQRGRFAEWNLATMKSLAKRAKGI